MIAKKISRSELQRPAYYQGLVFWDFEAKENFWNFPPKNSNGAIYDLLRDTKTCNPRFTELAAVLHNTEREKAPSDPSNVFLNNWQEIFFFHRIIFARFIVCELRN